MLILTPHTFQLLKNKTFFKNCFPPNYRKSSHLSNGQMNHDLYLCYHLGPCGM